MLDVGRDVAGGQVGGREVSQGVAWLRRGDEGYVPAENKVVQEFGGVEIGPENILPSRDVERRGRERDPKAVNVCGAAEVDGGGDPMDITLLVGWAGSERPGVAGAGRRTSSHDLFLVQELGPELVVGGVQAGSKLVIAVSRERSICRGKTER